MCVLRRWVMAVAGDSDAYSYINAKSRLSLREDDARQLMLDVLSALHYLHNQVCGEGGGGRRQYERGEGKHLAGGAGSQA